MQKHNKVHMSQQMWQLLYRHHRHPTLKVFDLNSIFSAIAMPQIPIKYLLHASHDSLGHVGATKFYHFLKWLHYFQGMRQNTSRCEILLLISNNEFTKTKLYWLTPRHFTNPTGLHIHHSSGTIQHHFNW